MSASRKKREPASGPPGTGGGFEDQMQRLELLVDRMESENLKLEDAISLFEEGMGLSKTLLDRLEKAEKRVEILIRKSRTEVEKRSLDADSILEGGGIDDDNTEAGDDDLEESDDETF